MPNSDNSLTPEGVLADLMEGNERFATSQVTNFQPELEPRMKRGYAGQHPKAFILSCVDSRVLVETLFDQSIGDLFVGRVAGSIGDTDQLASIEFAAKFKKVKVVLVLGHQFCEAIRGACNHVQMGHLGELFEKIQPAIDRVRGFADEERIGENEAFVEAVIRENVILNVERIRRESPVVEELERRGQLKIVGGYYSLKDGRVTLLKQ
jgi:carbonic anhydrase